MPERSEGRRVGRYLIRRRLGTGGFARVYLALDPDLDFEVALKVLKAQFADDPAAVERFRREATTAVRLRHPNVVTVLAVGRLDEEFDGSPADAPYLVMDFLPDSLASRLAATPVLPEAEVRRIGTEVARGLAYAHQAGVIHRDVKPDNILFGRDGQAVVTDFGIARAVADTLAPATRSAVVGTPSYFSPEQARGLPLDGRTDIYALGVTLYQAATGTLPFTGDDWYAVMRQHVEDPPVPPRRRNPALSPDLDAIILRCLAKDPAGRFASAADLADALAYGGELGRGGAPVLEAHDTHPTVVVDPFVASRASTRLATGGGRRWLVAGGIAGAALAATALGLMINATAVDGPPPLPGPAPDTTGAAVVGESGALAPLGPPGTALVDSTILRVPRAALAVAVPDGAELRVNGLIVGRGPWGADTLTPGQYALRASLPTGAGCPSGVDSETVRLAAGERRQLRLRPRGCGRLTILAIPTPANFTLVPVDGGPSREGRLPSTLPLILPEGTYRLTVSAPMCSEYTSEVVVTAGGTERKRVPLLC